jgi:hypothetical protein
LTTGGSVHLSYLFTPTVRSGDSEPALKPISVPLADVLKRPYALEVCVLPGRLPFPSVGCPALTMPAWFLLQYKSFEFFVHQQHAEENLYFYLACTAFRKLFDQVSHPGATLASTVRSLFCAKQYALHLCIVDDGRGRASLHINRRITPGQASRGD